MRIIRCRGHVPCAVGRQRPERLQVVRSQSEEPDGTRLNRGATAEPGVLRRWPDLTISGNSQLVLALLKPLQVMVVKLKLNHISATEDNAFEEPR